VPVSAAVCVVLLLLERNWIITFIPPFRMDSVVVMVVVDSHFPRMDFHFGPAGAGAPAKNIKMVLSQ